MRPIRFECQGFKRFRAEQRLDLAPRVVCIVGPNAAGKTSVLDALELSTRGSLTDRQRTRGLDSGTPTTVTVTFALEDADKAAIAHIPEAAEVKRFALRLEGNERETWLEPEVTRDLSLRGDVHTRLKALQEAQLSYPEPEDEEARKPSALLDAVVIDTGSLEQSFSPGEVQQVRDLAELLSSTTLPRMFKLLPDKLNELAKYEALDHPEERAFFDLPQPPLFIKFPLEARELRAAYELTEESNLALDNLLRLAGSSWAEAVEVFQGNNGGERREWERRVDAALADKFLNAWSQHDIIVSVSIDGSLLTLVMGVDDDEFFDIDEHSDGLLQFVALRAFVEEKRREGRPIVLLIDEAETHLHYDAQADLISVFEEQSEAMAVIYTTHSAGCLPRDIGVGIRAVAPVYVEKDGARKQTGSSRIISSIWEQGQDFSPFLLLLGASAFAFSATRFAAITEGQSDAMLLPSLIREVTGKPILDYQVVPGFSEATSVEVDNLDRMASRVAYVLDSDDGGEKNEAKLLVGGAKKEQMVYLGSKGAGLCVEDFVAKGVYLDAVNAELTARWSGVQMKAAEVPDTGRSHALDAWCTGRRDANKKVVNVYRVNVAQRILDIRLAEADSEKPRSLVATAQRARLRRLDEKLASIFEKATHLLDDGAVAAG